MLETFATRICFFKTLTLTLAFCLSFNLLFFLILVLSHQLTGFYMMEVLVETAFKNDYLV